MTTDVETPTHRKPLRLWPGVLIVALQWLLRFGIPVIKPEAVGIAMLCGLGGGLAVLLWWLFLSRAPWPERLGGVALIIGGLLVAPFILHPSIAEAAMGILYPIYAVPLVSLAFVVWAALARGLTGGVRWATMAAAVLAACFSLALIRTGGVTGDLHWDFHWRWSATPEERLLGAAEEPVAVRSASVEGVAEWPGFRGPGRDSHVPGVRIETDWTASPPVELWRRPVGPGWSSFAVHGDFIYTQEQRGDEELVACYRASTGEPVWRHGDPVRFWEPMAGAGPRGTPELRDGKVYTFGATGVLNALDATDGSVLWSRDAAADTGVDPPGWGFASSPLVVDDLVVVAVAAKLAAYDRATGEPRWYGETTREAYSSPHLSTIDGVEQILLLNGAGVMAVDPVDGTPLWEHAWGGFHSLQPAFTTDGDVLISSSDSNAGFGIRRLTVTRGPSGWKVDEGWTSRGLKPYFNDFVVHEGHAYGFDGRILSSIDLTSGERDWKGGRYGHGQLILLPDQDLLLVLSETGELALVEATPEGYSELARLPAIEGKTWNHPVLAGDLLLVRNGQEMAAYRLTLAGA